ncbi:uncharacterized protein LOC118416032 isoform X1 [Branchiostoma floridae]|uniref:chitin synthase n=1 Tax=Branchiostoma floridae TaxID=7739 RepID=A0A9J7MS32_BRAFL|nr:uncharacterized protein LOC118416032 isoform X1 [Branchiostoma floridae]
MATPANNNNPSRTRSYSHDLEITLTVGGSQPESPPPSAEDEEESEEEITSKYPVWAHVLKILFSFFIFLTVLTCACASKTALVVLLQGNTTNNGPGVEKTLKEESEVNEDGGSVKETMVTETMVTQTRLMESARVVMVGLLLVVPQVFTVLRCITCSSFGKKTNTYPWPSWRALILGLLCSVVEVTCLTVFCFDIAPSLDPPVLILVMSGTVGVQLFEDAVKSIRTRHHSYPNDFNLTRKIEKFLKFISSFANVAAVCAIVTLVFLKENSLELYQVITLPCVILLLSATWSKFAHKQMSKPHLLRTLPYEEHLYSARFKATLLSSFFKVVLTPLAIVVYNYVQFNRGFEIYSDGFAEMGSSPLLVPFLIQLFSSFLGYLAAWLACSTCIQLVGFVIPLFLCTPAAIALTFSICNLPILDLNLFRCYDMSSEQQWILIGTCALLWVTQAAYLLFVVRKSPTRTLSKEETLFYRPFYNGIFLEQNLLLNRRKEWPSAEREEEEHLQATVKHGGRVYVCTTMYRESEQEMSQLLHSIYRLSRVYSTSRWRYESHIFLDGGVRGLVLNEFALLLVSLLDEKLDITPADARKMETPYGVQLWWKLPGGMPFYIHMKDPEKVKQKKRWSQVMYLSYILDLRQKELLQPAYTQRPPSPSFMSVEGDEESEIDNELATQNSNTPPLGDEGFHDSNEHQAPGSRNMTATPYFSPVSDNDDSTTPDTRTDDEYFTVAEGESSWEDRGEHASDTDSLPPRYDGQHYRRLPVLPHHIDQLDDETFVLTTDADVQFTPESVAALLDLASRDRKVGAVSGRTHPSGTGPVVWYQIFDYAIGHWFQKVAEHVYGSVLCCPGCFSVFRARALRQVLPEYASMVSEGKPSQFLTKDMGEDRWLSTLLVEKGWRLEYGAVAECKTFCPDTLEEFFKQRRRWIPSTLANLLLLLKYTRKIARNNDSFSLFYALYVSLLLLSSLIAPATVLFIIAGGLQYSINLESYQTLLLMSAIVFIYMLICVWGSGKTQLLASKVMTFFFAVVMVGVATGLAISVVEDFEPEPTSPPPPTEAPIITMAPTSEGQQLSQLLSGRFQQTTVPNHLPFQLTTAPDDLTLTTMSSDLLGAFVDQQYQQFFAANNNGTSADFLPASVSTLYLGVLAAVHLVAAILHPTEFACIIPGLLYVLCLPSAYLVLFIYSICNLNDRSWGTRESALSERGSPWSMEKILAGIGNFFKRCGKQCCDVDYSGETRPILADSPSSSYSSGDLNSNQRSTSATNRTSSFLQDRAQSTRGETTSGQNQDLDNEVNTMYSDIDRSGGEDTFRRKAIPWLKDIGMKRYEKEFLDNGYEDTSFICTIKEEDLRYMGIRMRGHVMKLTRAISQLPEPILPTGRQVGLDTWLRDLGLAQYYFRFIEGGYSGVHGMEHLRGMTAQDLQEIGITKRGHITKLLLAIQMLSCSNDREKRIRKARQALATKRWKYLHRGNTAQRREARFWQTLRDQCLDPSHDAFTNTDGLKAQLKDLRNQVLAAVVIINVLWLSAIALLATTAKLMVLEQNIMGTVFIVIYAIVLSLQFVALLWHRGATAIHYLARIPYWSSRDETHSTRNRLTIAEEA